MEAAEISLIMDAPFVAADFDGTLASLRVDWKALRRRLAEECAARGIRWENGRGLDANLREIRRTHGEGAFEALCDITAQAEVDGFHPDYVHREIVDVLIRRRDLPLAVVSANTRRAVSTLLERPSLRGFRALVVAKEDVDRGKPHPEALLKACRHFDAAPHEAVMIGDSETDRRAASRAGFFTFVNVRDRRIDGPDRL